MNTLRVVSNGQVIHNELIATGSAPFARKVTKTCARAAATPGARIEVLTRYGWEARRLVNVRGTFYTRVA